MNTSPPSQELVVRYPLGSGNGSDLPAIDEMIEVGKGIVKRNGEKIALLSFGSMLGEAEKVADSVNATIVDMRFVKPLDKTLINELTATHTHIVTIEDNAIAGSAGSGVNEYILSQGVAVTI